MELDHIDKMLKALDMSRDTALQAMFFIDLIRSDPAKEYDFGWIEMRLRHLGCRHLFLLAVPLEYAPPECQVIDPLSRYECAFYVWHSVNGPAERTQTMIRFDILDDVINLRNLKRSGILDLMRT